MADNIPPSIIPQVMSSLDKFAASAMAMAGMPPVSVGKRGALFAAGVADYIKGMYATTEAALSSEVSLAQANEQYRIAALNASVERERIAANLKAASIAASAQEYAASVSAAAQRYAANKAAQASMYRARLEHDLGQQQIGLQKQALSTYQSSISHANAVENLAYSLASGSHSGGGSKAHSSSNAGSSFSFTNLKTGKTYHSFKSAAKALS